MEEKMHLAAVIGEDVHGRIKVWAGQVRAAVSCNSVIDERGNHIMF
jgi:hypothetical protein